MSSPSSSTSSLSPPPSPPSYTALDAASAARSGASFLAWPSDEPYYPTSSPSTSPPSSQGCAYTLAHQAVLTTTSSHRNYHRTATGGVQDGYYAPRDAASDAASGACFVAAWPGDGHHHYHHQMGAGHHHQGTGGGGQARHGHGKVHHHGRSQHKGAAKKGVVAVSGSRNK